MKQVIQLSYSSAKTLLSCEQKYWHYKVNKSPVDPDSEQSDALAVGKAFHTTVELSNHKQFVKEYLLKAVKENECEEHIALIEAMAKNYVEYHRYSGLKVVKCELGIQDDTFLGYIDAIATDSEGGWWIIDLKTAGRYDPSIIPTLPLDPQLNLYSSYASRIEEMLPELKGFTFRGTRYRIVTKSTMAQKAKETLEKYVERLQGSVKCVDISIPVTAMNPQGAKERHTEVWQRASKLHGGEAPLKNYGSCMAYFRPCEYFSQCHGKTHSENAEKVEVYTLDTAQKIKQSLDVL